MILTSSLQYRETAKRGKSGTAMIDDSIKRANNSTKTENINIVTTFFSRSGVFKNNSEKQEKFFVPFLPWVVLMVLMVNEVSKMPKDFFSFPFFLLRDLIQFALVQQIFADNHAEGKNTGFVVKHTSLFLS